MSQSSVHQSVHAADDHSVCIVGTEGVGKTVLLTVLAKRFGERRKDGLFLEPHDLTGFTHQYIEWCWGFLSQGEWPPPTTRGELNHLEWRLWKHQTPVARLRVIDPAGEDVRGTFSRGTDLKDSHTSADLKAKYDEQFSTAQTIVILVNLDDVVSSRDGRHKSSTEWIINHAIQLASKQGSSKNIAVVFTQVDRHGAWISRNGGIHEVVTRLFPGIELYPRCKVFEVAAVATTQVVIRDGVPVSVPSHNFGSDKLGEFMTWLAETVGGKSLSSDQVVLIGLSMLSFHAIVGSVFLLVHGTVFSVAVGAVAFVLHAYLASRTVPLAVRLIAEAEPSERAGRSVVCLERDIVFLGVATCALIMWVIFAVALLPRVGHAYHMIMICIVIGYVGVLLSRVGRALHKAFAGNAT